MGNPDQVTGLEQYAARVDAPGGEFGQVDVDKVVPPGQEDAGTVRIGREPAGTAECLRQSHGDVVDGQLPGCANFTVDIHSPGAIGLKAHRDLRVTDEAGQGLCDSGAGLFFGEADNTDGTDQRELNSSLRADVVPVSDIGKAAGIGS